MSCNEIVLAGWLAGGRNWDGGKGLGVVGRGWMGMGWMDIGSVVIRCW